MESTSLVLGQSTKGQNPRGTKVNKSAGRGAKRQMTEAKISLKEELDRTRPKWKHTTHQRVRRTEMRRFMSALQNYHTATKKQRKARGTQADTQPTTETGAQLAIVAEVRTSGQTIKEGFNLFRISMGLPEVKANVSTEPQLSAGFDQEQ